MAQKLKRRLNVVVATGLPKINDAFFGNEKMKKIFNVVEVVDNRNNIIDVVEKHPETDIVLVSDGLTGKGRPLTQIMIDVHLEFRDVRVVYLTSEVKRSQMKVRMPQLGYLVRTRIYDIVAQSPITMKHIFDALVKPATKEHVEWIFKFIDAEEETSAPTERMELVIDNDSKGSDGARGSINNLHVFSSIKPGTGKSFIATNIAAAIAKYGKVNEKGEKPRVALIDGDMQNLSIGTLLQVEDDKKNIKTVMDKIHLIQDSDGLEIDNPPLVAEVKAFVRNAFLPYSHIDNLHVLAGSNLDWREVQGFTAHNFTWLLQTIQHDYDVIIMDSSSSLAHVSTAPMMLLARDLYYILNLDFNNIRNNSRYQQTLIQYGVFDKVKYILNENISKDAVKEQEWKEDLLFDGEAVSQNGFNLVGSIPIVEKTTFLNRIFQGLPIALDNDNHTLEARVEISQIANQIWEIDNLPYLEDKYEKLKEAEQAGKRRGLFRK